MAFKYFSFESTRWRLFQKSVVRTKFDIFKVCITITGSIAGGLLCHGLRYTPPSGISDRGRFQMAILFRPFGFLAHKDLKIIWLSNILALSVTWWMLFKKRVVRTKLDIYVFINDIQNITQKTKNRATRIPLKSRGEIRSSV